MKKYMITYYTKLDNGFIDKRQIIMKNKYNANSVYNKLASEQRTINIELEELYWPLLPLTEYPSITKIKLFYSQNL